MIKKIQCLATLSLFLTSCQFYLERPEPYQISIHKVENGTEEIQPSDVEYEGRIFGIKKILQSCTNDKKMMMVLEEKEEVVN